MENKGAETTLLEDYVTSLRIGEATSFKNLRVFPLFSNRSSQLRHRKMLPKDRCLRYIFIA